MLNKFIQLTEDLIVRFNLGTDELGICRTATSIVEDTDTYSQVPLGFLDKYLGELYSFFLSQPDLRTRRYDVYTPTKSQFWFIISDTASRIELLTRFLNDLKDQ